LFVRRRPKRTIRPVIVYGNDNEHKELLQELTIAHQDWVCAQHRLDNVLGEDEIDYAIFALETAEKRYGMLLKQAKAMKVTAGISFRSGETPYYWPNRSVGG